MRPVKLTPSMLSFLWEDCPRCFWLRTRRGLRRPWLPFPSVFTKYHTVLEAYFADRCPSTLDPALPPGTCVHDETWVASRTLHLDAAPVPFRFKGRVDHLMQFDDGTWGIIDYKTTDQSTANIRKYGRQLHAYAWALEQAAPDALHRAPITRMGLLCLNPEELMDFRPCCHATVRLTPTWVEVPRDDTAFTEFLGAALTLLATPEPPGAGPACEICNYTRRRMRLERNLQQARTS